MPNPAITESEDYQDQFKIDQEQPAVNPSDELIKKLYGLKIPEPTYDQDKEDRLRRMGRINNLGRVVNVLGDIFSTAKGANTRRRQPDTTAPALYQAYQANLDKYKAEKDANLLRDYDKDRQDIIYQIGRNDRQEGIDYRNKVHEDSMKAQAAKNSLEWQKYLAGLKQKQDALDNTKDYQKKKLGLEGAKVKLQEDKLKQTQDKPFDPVQVKDKYGNSIKLDQGQWDNLYQNAMRDTEFTNGNLKAEISKYKELPDGGVKQIARAYYDYQKDKEFKAGEKAALERHRNAQTTSPVQTQIKPKLPGLTKTQNKPFAFPGLGKK